MGEYYQWFKAFHVIAIISWMVGMLYMPRLFVYHSMAKVGSETDLLLQIMERRLIRIIINPAMIVSFIFGILLMNIYGFHNLGTWFHIKLSLVILLTACHGMMSRWRKKFAKGENEHSDKFYRWFNEFITIQMIVIVIMVIVKPFE